MNILIINVDGNPQYIGGIKRVCVSLAKQWILQGINVSYICVGDHNKMFDSVAGIPQEHLPDVDDILSHVNKEFLCRFIQERGVDILLNPFMDCKDLTRLCAEVCKESGVRLVTAWHFSPTHFIDIVDHNFFAHYKLGNPIKRLLLDSFLWTKWRFQKRNQMMREWGRYFDECIENSDTVVFLSKRFLPAVEQMVGYHCDKVVAINNPNSFEVTDSINYSDKQKFVLWSGRLGYGMKRTDKMLSIWKRISPKHKDWKLIICGSGNAEYFKNLCTKFHVWNVEFPGFVNMEEYYAKSSILCNTSVTEGWGLVLVEAMQHGCIPMAFNSYASVHDIIEDGENGYIIPAFDEEEYARKLDMLMSDEEFRMKMATKGRESTKRFEPESIAQQWIELFEKMSQ